MKANHKTSSSHTIDQNIDTLTRQLRLPSVRSEFKEIAERSAKIDASYEDYLLALLEKERIDREIRRKKQRIRRAGFPFKKYLEDLQVDELPQAARDRLTELKRLDFIERGNNVILSGNPGTGKTHLAIGLGMKACQNDYKVLFTSVGRLIVQIQESRSQKTLRTLESRFEKYDLVICDEFGYITYDQAAAELLFTHLSLRAGRKSTIITTNLSFDRWNEIFADEILTAAMVDRLTHKAHMIDMNGESYRLKETVKWMNEGYPNQP